MGPINIFIKKIWEYGSRDMLIHMSCYLGIPSYNMTAKEFLLESRRFVAVWENFNKNLE